jgi:cobalt transporter subunit CbtA
MVTAIARLLGAALAAGVTAGLIASFGQSISLTPLILAAEQFEIGEHGTPTPDGPHAASHNEGEAWQPDGGIERIAYTVLSNILVGTGFALLLSACLTLYRGRVDGARGVAWGLGGFAAFSLAPALGFPPELPGSAGAELGARQAWWLSTACASAIGLALLFLQKRVMWRVLGVVAIAAPHIAGAPHAPLVNDTVPPDLAAHFAIGSLVISALSWSALGCVAGFALRRPQ